MKKWKDQTNNASFKVIADWINPSKIPQKNPFKFINEKLNNEENEQPKIVEPKMYINREESTEIIKKGHPIKKL